ncbi:MAG: hypothetical protein QOE93_1903, partial [Actinomycetota bacterium]|nr:hypothetical protein [Actinomycetota bacterium]
MHTAIAATADGVGQAIVVEGPPGIGKTRLVNEALAGAGAQGLRVLRARAEELDSHRPFGTIADALGITRGAVEPPLAEIARLLFGAPTGLGGGTDGALPGAGGDSEFRLVEAMLALVDNLCTRQPVVIAIDDVHWADPATIVVLHRLSRSVRDMPLVVLATCRPTPRPPQLTRLIGSVRDAGHEPLALAPLAPDEVTQLVESVIGRQPGPRLVRQAEAAGGNPFFVTALVAALEASGSMTTTATTAEIDVVSLPPALKLTVLHRLSFITADTLEMLRMASILGTTFSVPDLALVLRRRSVELMPAFREAIDANVIREQGDKIAFEHDLLREALYEDLPLSLRVSLHRDVALTLAGAGAPLVQVAEHFVRGARRGDATALEWLRRAADEATVRTPEIASDLLRRMTDLIDPGDPTRDLVLADWAVSLDMSGRRREAEEICREVLTRPQDPRNEARLRLCLSRTLAVTGRVDEAIEEATRAAALEGLSAVQRARTLGNAANLHLMLARIDRLEELGTVALGAAEEVGDPIAWDIAIFGLAAVAFNRGRFAEALERSSMLRMEDDPQPGARMAQGVLHLHLAAGLLRSELFLRLDRVDESQAALEGTRRRATDFGFRGMLCRAQCTVILHNFLTGDWDDAAAEFDALLDLCEDLEDHPAILLISYSVRSMVALYRGDGAQAAAMLAEAGAYRSLDPYRDQWYTTAQVLLARASGATETAFDLLSEEWDRCVRSGILVPCVNLG